MRTQVFRYDPKLRDKGSMQFEAHCIDSFVIAMSGITTTTTVNVTINKDVLFIEKKLLFRRCLNSLRPIEYNEKRYYYKKLKGGIKQPYVNMSKNANICRIKLDGDNSNHPKQWRYINNKKSEKIKQKVCSYGGTTFFATFKNNEFVSRVIC